MPLQRLQCLLLVFICATSTVRSASEIEKRPFVEKPRRARSVIMGGQPADKFKEEVLAFKDKILNKGPKRQQRKNKSAILSANQANLQKPAPAINFKDYQVPIEPFDSLFNAATAKDRLEKAGKFLKFIKHSDDPTKLSFVFEVARCNDESLMFKPVNDDLSQFDLSMYSDLRNLRQQFASIFDQVFRSLPNTFMKRFELNFDREKNFLKEDLVKALQKIKPEYINYRNTFSSKTKLIEEQLLKLECGMKDFMTFYSILPRFYWAYKKEIARSEKQEDFFTDLAILKSKWLINVNKALNQYYLLKSWVSIFGDIYLHLSNNPNDERSLEYFAFLNKHSHLIIASKSMWRQTLVQFKTIDEQLRKIIRNIEKKNEMADEELPDFSDFYAV